MLGTVGNCEGVLFPAFLAGASNNGGAPCISKVVACSLSHSTSASLVPPQPREMDTKGCGAPVAAGNSCLTSVDVAREAFGESKITPPPTPAPEVPPGAETPRLTSFVVLLPPSAAVARICSSLRVSTAPRAAVAGVVVPAAASAMAPLRATRSSSAREATVPRRPPIRTHTYTHTFTNSI